MRITQALPSSAVFLRVNPTWRAWVLAICATLAAPGITHAGATCSITANGVSFGVYDTGLGGSDDSAGTVTVTCVYVAPGATNVNYRVVLSPGLNSVTAADRQMASGTTRLRYNLFEDSARSAIWGDGFNSTVLATGGMTVGPGVGNGIRIATHTLYGRIPGLQDVLPGHYADTLVLTLNY